LSLYSGKILDFEEFREFLLLQNSKQSQGFCGIFKEQLALFGIKFIYLYQF